MIDPEAPYLGTFVCSVCDRRQNVLATNSKKWLIRVNPSKTRDNAESGQLEVAWEVFCPECKGEPDPEHRWNRKDYYCSHCTMMIPIETYRNHVIQCLESDLAHKQKMMMATGSSNENQAAGSVTAPAAGLSGTEQPSTRKPQDSGTPPPDAL